MMREEFAKLYEPGQTAPEALERLTEIVKILRRECPWDRAQTHESLRTCMIEEAYEAVNAINEQDTANLREELGDVLLQVVLHSRLGEETDHFCLTDVINEECEKMIRRHPHIFLEEKAKTIDKALEKWENMKSKELGDMSYTDKLQKVPKAFPALLRSSKVQNKAAQIGFDWPDVSGAFAKVEEELAELREACQTGDEERISEEFGDLLFSMVNVSRFLGIDPEASLHGCTAKFIRRFSFMERVAAERGIDLAQLPLAEMDKLWDAAKGTGSDI